MSNLFSSLFVWTTNKLHSMNPQPSVVCPVVVVVVVCGLSGGLFFCLVAQIVFDYSLQSPQTTSIRKNLIPMFVCLFGFLFFLCLWLFQSLCFSFIPGTVQDCLFLVLLCWYFVSQVFLVRAFVVFFRCFVILFSDNNNPPSLCSSVFIIVSSVASSSVVDIPSYLSDLIGGQTI